MVKSGFNLIQVFTEVEVGLFYNICGIKRLNLEGTMRNTVKYEGYTFEKINDKGYRPYKVKCYETGEEKSSSISFEDAMNLIISSIEYGKSVLHIKSLDKSYVEGVFKETLLDKKLSEINDIVRDEIAGKKIEGEIICYIRDEFNKSQVYTTEKYRIIVSYERERIRVITKITVEEKE